MKSLTLLNDYEIKHHPNLFYFNPNFCTFAVKLV